MMSRKKLNLLIVVFALFISLFSSHPPLVYGQSPTDLAPTLIVLTDSDQAKGVVSEITSHGGVFVVGTAHQGQPAIIAELPEAAMDTIASWPGVVSLQPFPSFSPPLAVSTQSVPVPIDPSWHPNHGPDGTETEPLAAEHRAQKELSRRMSTYVSSVFGWPSLSEAERGKIDGVVQQEALLTVVDAAQVQAYLPAAGERSGLSAETAQAIQSTVAGQTMSVIIQLDELNEANRVLITANVHRVNHILESINAIAAEVSPLQLKELAQLPFVRYIWPDAEAEFTLDAESSLPQIGGDTIHAMGLDGFGVQVAVVDNGMEDSHPAYSERVYAIRSGHTGQAHATHVAGIIGSSNNDYTGVAPSAFLADAVTTNTASDVTDALEWAVNEAQADVVNMSIGFPLWRYPRDGTAPVDQAIDNLVQQNGLDAYNTTIVVAASNEAEQHDTGTAHDHPEPGLIWVYTHVFTVNDSSDDLRLTLWWDDPANDLDLKVYAPDGTEVASSVHDSGLDVPTNDQIVMEQVLLSEATLRAYGSHVNWEVKVLAEEIPHDPHLYHLGIDITSEATFASPNPVGTIPSPGTARYAITVGSVGNGLGETPLNQLSDFSCQGPTGDDPGMGYRIKPELVAPGDLIWSSVPGGYDQKRGTSQAAPHVAGTAALLLEAAGVGADGTWQLNYYELRGALIDTASDLDGDQGIDNTMGAGLVYPTNAIFNGTIDHHQNQYFKITPKYTTATYPGVTGQVLSFGWETLATHWSSASNDLDLHLYRFDNGSEEAFANLSDSNYEKISGLGVVPEDHDYVLRVYGWFVGGAETYYGVSTNDIEPVAPPNLVVTSLPANPTSAFVDETFTLEFDIENDGELPARSTSISINTPPGITLVSGSNPQSLGELAPDEHKTASWTFRGTSAGSKTFTTNANSSTWGATWSGSDSHTVNLTSAPVVGPLVFEKKSIDDDNTGLSSGNNNGQVDCGETIELDVTLRNEGNDTADEVVTVLSESDPYVSILNNVGSDYPDIPGNATADNFDTLELWISSTTPDGHLIQFDVAADAANNNSGGVWESSFEIAVVCNQPPYEPVSPSPGDGGSNVSVISTLTWSGGDPEDDGVTYDVYLEANDSTPDEIMCENIMGEVCNPGLLAYGTTYYWYVVATDDYGNVTTGDTWQFTTEPENHGPTTPNAPSPGDGVGGVPVTTHLSWSASDPDGDSLSYDVYFGANDPFPDTLVCENITAQSCDPGPLDYETHYYWYVIADDGRGASSTGPVWDFTTETPPPTVGPLVYNSHTIDDDASGQSSGNNDGVVNCGETIELYVELYNQGNGTASSVQATISTSDAYITWPYNTDSSYPDVAGRGTATNSNDFDFAVSSGTPDGHLIHFDLSISAANGGSWSDSFDVPVVCNHAPDAPSTPSPTDGAGDQNLNLNLTWTGGDPDPGDTVTYDVYFEMDDPTPDVLICNHITTPACDPGTLSYSSHYYWYVVATDSHGLTRTGPTWDFTTLATPNHTPYEPSNPSPPNIAMNQSVYTDLSWTGGDPDPGDTVTYDVYFGTSNPPPLVSSNQTETTYDPGLLTVLTRYYWQIIARDNHGETTAGPVWWFWTEEVQPGVGPVEYHSHRIVEDGSGWSQGNGDGFINCGEQFELYLTLHNDGDETATGVSVDVWPSEMSYVVPIYESTTHGDIISAGLAENDVALLYGVVSEVPDGLVVHMDLDIEATNAGPWTDTFDITVVCDTGSPGDVRINEVDAGLEDWVELYNADDEPVDMGGWHLIGYYDTDSIDTDYTIPAGFTLQPGAYVVVHEGSGTNTPTDLYTGGSFIWMNGEGGAVALTDGTTGVDFVRFGDNMTSPPAGTTWTGSNPPGPPSGVTLGRDELSTDTDDGSDWSDNVPTPHAANIRPPTCYALSLTHFGEGSDPVASPSHSDGCASGTYVEGEVINLTATPGSEWYLLSWEGTDNNISTETTNSLTMPANDHTAAAYYQPNCYPLKLAHTGAGSDPLASPANSDFCRGGEYVAGATITLSAGPDSGWHIVGWSGTAHDNSTALANSLVMPNQSHLVTVTYAENPILVINEVDLSSDSWTELYNPGPAAVDLTGCHFLAYDAGGTIEVDYLFPNGFSISPDGYLVIHEGNGPNSPTDLYLGQNIASWSNGTGGAVSIVCGATGVDFVRWAGATAPPPSGTNWTGPNPPSPPAGQVLARDENSLDTDHGSDWTLMAATPGARNLILLFDLYLPLVLR